MLSPEQYAAVADDPVRDLATAVRAVHAHCSVYTSTVVANAILDAVGWRGDADLKGCRLLEPCCGDGAFLLPATDRLLAWARRAGCLSELVLADAIRAYEFDPATAAAAREAVVRRLASAGLPVASSARIAARWVRCEDLLVAKIEGGFTHIVGNPPYMRWSKLPRVLRQRYEAAVPKSWARGDLCLAFLWRATQLADATRGVVAFLCADRWLRCAYGESARSELRSSMRVALHVEAHDVPVFDGRRKVSTYAAVTILDRHAVLGTTIRAAKDLSNLASLVSGHRSDVVARGSRRLLSSAGGSVIAPADLYDVISLAADTNPNLTEAGVSIRCGMALGHARAFLVDKPSEIEADRLLPFVRSQDLLEDGTTNASKQLIDVWDEARLIDLAQFPKLAAHLEAHKQQLSKRACVADESHWYRTIDRPHRERDASRILVAGMAKRSRVAMAQAGEQPGNAVYVLSSKAWPTEALFALLRGGLLDIFAAALSPTFSGASRRFDGNVLRQVRIPIWSSLDSGLQKTLLEVDVAKPCAMQGLIADVLGIRRRRLRGAIANVLSGVFSE